MKKHSAVLGAAFLMATSAIGPGFLTQTTRFTAELLASFGFVILVSLLLDIGAQLNIWRIVAVSNRRAQDIANAVLPGLGWALAGLIGFGRLVFNIGNIGGTGLGLNALTGLDVKWGAVVSCLLSLGIFWQGQAGKIIDWFVKILGLAMIGFTAYVALSSKPPLAEALYRTVWPQRIDVLKIVTLVGGTVGGYISFAGAHRLLEAGISGRGALPQVGRSAVSGILITSVMRFVLFFAALGVAVQGAKLSEANPAASVFSFAAGDVGQRFFGLVMWSAAITSVVGASYTTVSFFRTLHPIVERRSRVLVSLFILASTVIFLFFNNPAGLLVAAGAVNGFILPLALAVMLLAANKKAIVGDYRHPLWLQVAGWVVVVVMAYLCWLALVKL